jgi:uncharacterized protein (DUF433 family)
MLQQLTNQTIRPAKTSLGAPASVYFDESVYVDPEIVAGLQGYNQTTAVYITSNYTMPGKVNPNAYFELGTAIALFSYQSAETEAQSFNRALAERLCREHPDISTDPGIYGGNPHIKNVRLTVGNILAKIYIYGSTKAVADIYAPHVDEGQIKEAIAYAQDFLEAAIHPHQAPEGDGR